MAIDRKMNSVPALRNIVASVVALRQPFVFTYFGWYWPKCDYYFTCISFVTFLIYSSWDSAWIIWVQEYNLIWVSKCVPRLSDFECVKHSLSIATGVLLSQKLSLLLAFRSNGLCVHKLKVKNVQETPHEEEHVRIDPRKAVATSTLRLWSTSSAYENVSLGWCPFKYHLSWYCSGSFTNSNTH